MIVTFLEEGLVAEGLPGDIAVLYKLLQAQKVQLVQNIVVPGRRPIGHPKVAKKPRIRKAMPKDVVEYINGYTAMHEKGISGNAWVVLHTLMKHTKLNYPIYPTNAKSLMDLVMVELEGSKDVISRRINVGGDFVYTFKRRK